MLAQECLRFTAWLYTNSWNNQGQIAQWLRCHGAMLPHHPACFYRPLNGASESHYLCLQPRPGGGSQPSTSLPACSQVLPRTRLRVIPWPHLEDPIGEAGIATIPNTGDPSLPLKAEPHLALTQPQRAPRRLRASPRPLTGHSVGHRATGLSCLPAPGRVRCWGADYQSRSPWAESACLRCPRHCHRHPGRAGSLCSAGPWPLSLDRGVEPDQQPFLPHSLGQLCGFRNFSTSLSGGGIK